MVTDAIKQAVLARIDRDEVAELAYTLGGIDSTQGSEEAVATWVHDWLAQRGFQVRKVGMFPNRFNLLGVLPGSGRGCSLLFNSHLDTIALPPSFKGPNGELVWRDGDAICGGGVVNDKGPLACFLVGVDAIRQAGAPLLGNVLVTAVVGETGGEPVDEFQGPEYHHKDLGSRYLITHGGVADYAIVAETTRFKVGWVEAGKAFFKITVSAQELIGYTPYIKRPVEPGREGNAAVLAARLIQRIEEWAVDYERRHTYECAGGTVIPKINVGAVRCGTPYFITRVPSRCTVYLECRISPNQDPLAIGDELRDMTAELGIPADIELFLYRPGYEGQGVELLVERLGHAHTEEFGTAMEVTDWVQCSMWRDHNVFNEMGIPAVIYGPGGSMDGRDMRLRIVDLEAAARVYALTALEVCLTPK